MRLRRALHWGAITLPAVTGAIAIGETIGLIAAGQPFGVVYLYQAIIFCLSVTLVLRQRLVDMQRDALAQLCDAYTAHILGTASRARPPRPGTDVRLPPRHQG